jgi:hypothetical protein
MSNENNIRAITIAAVDKILLVEWFLLVTDY